jgi:2-polyprenyl-6-methoxyphenol hydroxylase-like FAD-dependent oxidoreductase
MPEKSNAGGQQPEVLIVGAGPTGLILAHELLRRGVRCRMVEKRHGPSGATRAFTLHSRTMEMFDHMGIAERIEDLREICPGNRFHFKGVPLSEDQMPMLDFRRLRNTQYNYYGKVNQNDLDQALRNALAAKYSFYPEYGVEFKGLDDSRDGLRVELAQVGIQSPCETARPAWIIGADGSQSAVRHHLGAEFKQKDGADMTMSMVDVHLDGYRGDREWVNYYVADKGFMLVTGLPGNRYRLYLAGALEKLLEDAEPRDAFQKGLDFFDTGAKIASMDWSSSWVIRKIVGDVYRRGNIILCGDATHVHSPAGGQGMNACMQDAFNLGWKLANVINGHADASLLDSYAEERRPIAEQVTAGANSMHQILFNAEVPVEDRFKITQDPRWHDEAIYRISGLSHNYRDLNQAGSSPEVSDIPATGDRAPDCVLEQTAPRKRLYDAFRHPSFTLVMTTGSDPEDLATCERIRERVQQRFGLLVKPLILLREQGKTSFDYDHTLYDPNGNFATAYGNANQGQLLLVRPDLYIGFRGALSQADAMLERVSVWLIK